MRVLFTRAAAAVTRLLARAAGVPRHGASWRTVAGPTFHNSVGVLELEGREGRVGRVAIQRSGTGDNGATFLSGLQAIEVTGAPDRARRRRPRPGRRARAAT